MILRVILAILFIDAACVVGVLCLVVQPFVAKEPSHPMPVDPARLAAHVKRLSVDLYPRSADRFGNLERAAKYIQDEFVAAGAEVESQPVQVEEAKYRNIVAHFGPKTGPLLIIGAHYDSFGNAGAGARYPRGYSPQTHTPGADDNASGVAGLIELAHLLGKSPQKRPIELVAYTLEEPPYFGTQNMGSAWHARFVRKARRDVRMMLSLEMIGYFSDRPGSQAYPLRGMTGLYSDRGNFIAVVGKFTDFGATRRIKGIMSGATDLPVYSINAPPLLQGIDFSDHLSYWREGFPALMITDTAFYRNRSYHAGGDTWERLDYPRMAKVVEAVYALTQNF